MKISRNLILLVLLSILACNEDKEGVFENYPFVSTLEVTNITSEGATFIGEVSNAENSPITAVGFMWSTIGQDDSDMRELSPENLINGRFEFDVTATLEEDVDYQVRAFIRTETYKSVGNEVSFKSLGSGAPEISSVSPLSVSYLDTITIEGKNFSNLPVNNQVRLAGANMPIVATSDSLLKIYVTDAVRQTTFNISVLTAGNIVTYSEPLEFLAPEITSLSTSEVVIGDTISVNGHYFGFRKDLNEITINDLIIEPLETDSNYLKLVIPIVEEPLVLSVSNILGQRTSNSSLKLLAPQITALTPAQAFYGDPISISGQNFSHVEEVTKVFFNDTEATITDHSNEQIEVIVPSGINNPIEVKVEVNGVESNKADFLFVDFEIDSFLPTEGTWRDVVTVSGSNFSEILSDHTILVDGHSAELISGDENEITFSIPDEVRSKSAIIQVSRKERKKSINQPFTMNDPEITNLSSLSIDIEESITVSGNNFHPEIEGNLISLDGESLNVLSASRSSLTIQASNNIVNDTRISQTLSGPLNISNGISNVESEIVEIKYHAAWTKILIDTQPNGGQVLATVSNGKILLFSNDSLHIYDPILNAWHFETEIPTGNLRRFPVIFETNNNIYVGLGISTEEGFYDNLSDLWRYDLDSKTWSQLNQNPFIEGAAKSFEYGGDTYIFSRSAIAKLYINSSIIIKYDPDLDSWELIKEMTFDEIDYDKRYIAIESALEREGSLYYFVTDRKNHVGITQANGYFYRHDLSSNTTSLEFSQSSLKLSQPRTGYYLNSTIMLLSSYRFYLESWGSNLTEFSHPFDVQGGKNITSTTEADGILYLCFNNGEIWSFDPSLD
ncbi:MAG: IPT/TIG domain-containing protein [Cyclobacteriaceae bacterium]